MHRLMLIPTSIFLIQNNIDETKDVIKFNTEIIRYINKSVFFFNKLGSRLYKSKKLK